MLFPGQGSQYVGMLGQLACLFPGMHAAISRMERGLAAEGSRPGLRSDLSHVGLRRRRAARAKDVGTAGDRGSPSRRSGRSAWACYASSRSSASAPRLVGRSQLRRARPSARPVGSTKASLAMLAHRRGALMAGCAADAFGGDARRLRAGRVRSRPWSNEHGLELVIANKNVPRQCVLSGSAA